MWEVPQFIEGIDMRFNGFKFFGFSSFEELEFGCDISEELADNIEEVRGIRVSQGSEAEDVFKGVQGGFNSGDT